MDHNYRIKRDNDTGPNDDYFREWWDIIHGGEIIAKCDDEEDAKRIFDLLVGTATRIRELEEALKPFAEACDDEGQPIRPAGIRQSRRTCRLVEGRKLKRG
jgi:hypothetical protein